MDFEAIAKQSTEEFQKLAKFETAKHFARAALPAMAGIMGTAGLFAGAGYLNAKRALKAQQNQLAQAQAALLSHEPFKNDPDRFKRRFRELAILAPAVATNPQLARKIIEPRLQSGFDLDDAHRLSAIEFHVGNSPKLPDPEAVAKNQAMAGLGKALNYILPAIPIQAGMSQISQKLRHETSQALSPEDMDLMKKVLEVSKENPADPFNEVLSFRDPQRDPHDIVLTRTFNHLAKQQGDLHGKVKEVQQRFSEHFTPEQHQQINAWRQGLDQAVEQTVQKIKDFTHKKEGSDMSQKISDQCLGKMLADTHLMCKEAGLFDAKNATAILKDSGSNMLLWTKLMTVPLALSVGYAAIKGYQDSKKKQELHREADKVFAALNRSSDTIRANPAIATQAFDALKSFAPALAAKPLIAKTFVENVVDSQGRLDPNTANMLATTQQAIQSLDKHVGFIQGLKEPLSLFSVNPPGFQAHKKKDVGAMGPDPFFTLTTKKALRG